MLFNTVAFATSAAAFLVVPAFEPADEEGVFKALPIKSVESTVDRLQIPESAFSQVLAVSCYECNGGDSLLELVINVDDDGKRLLVNGFEMYPTVDPWAGDLTAAFLDEDCEREVTLGYGFSVHHEDDKYAKDEGLEVVDLLLDIIQVDNQFLEEALSVNIQLVEAPSGYLFITKTGTSVSQDPACTTLWCRMKEMWDQAFQGLKGCDGMKEIEDDEAVEDVWYEQHDAVEDEASLVETLLDIGLYDIVPALMGIAAGMGVAFFSLFICSMAFRIARFAFKGRCRASEPAKNHEEATYTEEKASLVAESEYEDLPPQYEDEPTKN